MELRHLLRLLRRFWWLLLLGAFLFAIPAYLRADASPPTYQARTLVFVNVLSAPGSVTYSDALLSQQLVQSYSEMIRQPIVLEEVRTRLDLPYGGGELAGMVKGRPQRDTQLLEVIVTGPDPEHVAAIANTTVETFIDQQARYLPPEQLSGAIRVAQPALVPATPIGPNPLRSAALAGIIGLLLAAAGAYVYEYLDDTVKTSEELEAAGGIPSLGSVMRFTTAKDDSFRLLSSLAPNRYAETFRLLRTNLEFAAVDHPLESVLVTSAAPQDGKSTTAANLAVVLAQSAKRVVLVDADLRKPSLHHFFKLPNKKGLSSMLLTDQSAWSSMLQPTSVEHLQLLSSGPLPPNPVELLSSPRFLEVLDWLRSMAEIIVIDSPPVLPVADAIVLASRVDGTLLVVDSSRTRARTVRDAVNLLGRSGTRIVGAVLNKAGSRSSAYPDYGGYYHSPDDSDTNQAAAGRKRGTASTLPDRIRGRLALRLRRS